MLRRLRLPHHAPVPAAVLSQSEGGGVSLTFQQMLFVIFQPLKEEGVRGGNGRAIALIP